MTHDNPSDRDRVNIASESGGGDVAVFEEGIRIKPDGGPVEVKRNRGGIGYLLLDTSNSMSGSKLDQAKQGVVEFAKEARLKGYRFGLISFGTYASHQFAPKEDLTALRRAVEPLEAGGSTNMSGAIGLAKRKLAGEENESVIVIATDGMPDNPESALAVATESVNSGMDIITVGTDGADRSFLRRISSRDDLVVTVDRAEFEEGITSTARMLPGGDQ